MRPSAGLSRGLSILKEAAQSIRNCSLSVVARPAAAVKAPRALDDERNPVEGDLDVDAQVWMRRIKKVAARLSLKRSFYCGATGALTIELVKCQSMHL